MDGKMLDNLDHPIVFALLITFVVLGMSALMTYGFKLVGWTGPASLSQNP